MSWEKKYLPWAKYVRIHNMSEKEKLEFCKKWVSSETIEHINKRLQEIESKK